MPTLRAFWNDTSGTTAIEYALIGTCISIVIVAAVTTIGTRIQNLFLGPLASRLS